MADGLDVPAAGAAKTPQISSTPMARKTTTATTLSRANQNSNSPNLSAPSRLIAVRTTRKMRVSSQTGGYWPHGNKGRRRRDRLGRDDDD